MSAARRSKQSFLLYSPEPLRICNILGILTEALSNCSFIGVQVNDAALTLPECATGSVPSSRSKILPSWQLFSRLSALMICEFTVALRRRNMKKTIPNLSDIHLPTLSLPFQDDQVQTRRSILGRLHEGLVTEMAERPDPADNPNSGELDIDDFRANSPEVNPNNAI
ncbi:hypothetical protein Clacol_000098 [Clathrus columnatus]|uniref:Uncharacterized protein n=1 Tax=Clathrus columnatus TaxID=1419009 RepID=A0AAV4ZW65_9AGAM|nr:hypothetical protein Clacol_000098 [Clathrus columnatus]